MNENKNHWYDGWFYDKFIAPNQDKAFDYVKSIIEFNSSLVDVGCGTGRFAFQMEDICSRIDGIDPSSRNIKVAKKRLIRISSGKINFYHSDTIKFFDNNGADYDYALLSYVIHEVDELQRENILRALSQSANKIIIIDYLAPKPKNAWRYLNEIVEFAAGTDHYKNFKSYIKNNGIKGLAEQSGLKIVHEIKNRPSASHIALLQKEDWTS